MQLERKFEKFEPAFDSVIARQIVLSHDDVIEMEGNTNQLFHHMKICSVTFRHLSCCKGTGIWVGGVSVILIGNPNPKCSDISRVCKTQPDRSFLGTTKIVEEQIENNRNIELSLHGPLHGVFASRQTLTMGVYPPPNGILFELQFLGQINSE